MYAPDLNVDECAHYKFCSSRKWKILSLAVNNEGRTPFPDLYNCMQCILSKIAGIVMRLYV